MGKTHYGGMGSGLGWSANSAKEGHLEVRPTRAGRSGICQLIDGSMTKGLPEAAAS